MLRLLRGDRSKSSISALLAELKRFWLIVRTYEYGAGSTLYFSMKQASPADCLAVLLSFRCNKKLASPEPMFLLCTTYTCCCSRAVVQLYLCKISIYSAGADAVMRYCSCFLGAVHIVPRTLAVAVELPHTLAVAVELLCSCICTTYYLYTLQVPMPLCGVAAVFQVLCI